MSTRIEYFTLAVGNAKSHPVTAIGRHETAIAFLTDLEEKLDVAQVQLEVCNALLPHAGNPGEEGHRIRQLNQRLFTMSEVCHLNFPFVLVLPQSIKLYQSYAEPFDLSVMKLLILHVSEHRDEHIVRPIWDRLFEDGRETFVCRTCAVNALFSFGKGHRRADARRPYHSERCSSRKAFLPFRKCISAAYVNRFCLLNGLDRSLFSRICRDAAHLVLVAEQGSASKRLGSSGFGSMWRATRRDMGCSA